MVGCYGCGGVALVVGETCSKEMTYHQVGVCVVRKMKQTACWRVGRAVLGNTNKGQSEIISFEQRWEVRSQAL